MNAKVKIVRPQTKGMVTIPIEFREKLEITEKSLMEARLVENGVLFVKIDFFPSQQSAQSEQAPVELYSDKQIKDFLKADKIDAATEKKLKKLLSSR